MEMQVRKWSIRGLGTMRRGFAPSLLAVAKSQVNIRFEKATLLNHVVDVL